MTTTPHRALDVPINPETRKAVAKPVLNVSQSLRALHLTLLVLAAGGMYLFDANNDLLGVNDFLKGRHSAIFAGLLDWTSADVASPAAALSKILVPAHAFTFYPHGPLPPVYFGFFYKFLDLIGVPFSAFVIQLPTALLAMGAVALFYLCLVKARLDPWIAFFAALIVSLSPIYVLSARGISTYWAIAIVFNQAFAIYALQNLKHTRASKILVSVAFVHILLSDVLSFLVFAALIVGYGLRDFSWRWNPAMPLDMLRHMRHSLAPLASPLIIVPSVLTVLFLGAVSAYALSRSDIGGGIPIYPVLMFWALTAHGGELFSGDSLSLSIWLTRIVHALGEASPLLIIASLAALAMRARSEAHDFLWHFSWIAALGFGLLFFVIANDHPTTLYLDQSYLLIPFVAFAVFQLNRLKKQGRWGGVTAIGILALTSLGALTSSITAVWSSPVSLLSERLIVDRKSDIWGDALGFKMPNDGHRAAGYIVRSLLSEAWPISPDLPLEVSHASRAHPRAYEPFLIYAGLIQKGDWFANEFGIKPRITYLHIMANQKTEQKEACGSAPLCGLRTSTTGYESQYLPIDEELPCPAGFCVSVSFGATQGAYQRYELMSGDELRQVVDVRGLPTDALPPGRYQIDDLDRRFEQRFARLWDYFPKRAQYRTIGIVQQLTGLQ